MAEADAAHRDRRSRHHSRPSAEGRRALRPAATREGIAGVLGGRRAACALALPLLLLLVATGCGGSGKPSICAKRDDVKSSVDQLLKVNPADGLNGVSTQVVAVQASVNLASAAGSQYQPQISALQSSLQALVTQVQGLSGNPSAAALAALAPAVQQVKTSLTALTDAVGSACD